MPPLRRAVLLLVLASIQLPGFSWAAALPPAEGKASTPTTATGAGLQEDLYVLGPGDGLQLRFLAATELSTPLDVLNDGTASIPLIGSVRLSGLTLAQANGWLTGLYRKQLLRPELLLSVIRPRPLRVAVVGEVERPGLYTLTSSETSNTEAKVSITGLPTLVDVLQKAGGITAMANLREVRLQRRLPGEPTRFKQTRLDLLALVQQGDQRQNPLLFDGDTVQVEKAAEAVPEAIELASTTLSPDKIKVYVVGEVVRPGAVDLKANTPLVQAVLAAGGAQNWRANTAAVQLIRINRNGSALRQSFQLNLGEGASNQANPPLRNGDTVVVNRSLMAATSDAISAVTTPLTGLASVLSLIQLINNSRR